MFDGEQAAGYPDNLGKMASLLKVMDSPLGLQGVCPGSWGRQSWHSQHLFTLSGYIRSIQGNCPL